MSSQALPLRLEDLGFPSNVLPSLTPEEAMGGDERIYAVIVGYETGVYNKLDMLCSVANIPEAAVQATSYAGAVAIFRRASQKRQVHVAGEAPPLQRVAFVSCLFMELRLRSATSTTHNIHMPTGTPPSSSSQPDTYYSSLSSTAPSSPVLTKVISSTSMDSPTPSSAEPRRAFFRPDR
ncbi:hypothetical protein K488DRAFT_89747 [Vararia minispora EC-137]|uniref:Uncharacterized protein n=1 Tax=Vararia minispora EC-137 TaxID=1314806 RepID=A0ACB8Q9X1_9AGAM|nr:hypothetical protein K488DRAFT_89747 [Vararia minispora EC-137]